MPKDSVYTTGEVAKMCKVAPRTVSKWFDSGRLKGYRIPGSQDRRIPHKHLVSFLREHGMPLGELEQTGEVKLLIVANGDASAITEWLNRAKPEDVQIRTADNAAKAGATAALFQPSVVMIDRSCSDASTVAHTLHEIAANAIFIGLRKNGESYSEDKLFRDTFSRESDAGEVLQRIFDLTQR